MRLEWEEEKKRERMGRKGGKAKSKKASSRQHETQNEGTRDADRVIKVMIFAIQLLLDFTRVCAYIHP